VTDNVSETADGSTLFEAAHHIGILSKLANPGSSKRGECVSFAELGVGKSPSKIVVMLERSQFGAFGLRGSINVSAMTSANAARCILDAKRPVPS
jgi:hypothetical protein